MWFFVLWAIGLISGIVDVLFVQHLQGMFAISRTLLLHQFVVTFGLTALINGYCHLVLGEKIASKYGWPSGPFQAKYGFWTLSVGVLGVFAIFYQDHFWLAPLLNMLLFGISGAWTHLSEMINHKKIDGANVGNILMDVAYQTFIIILSVNARVW